MSKRIILKGCLVTFDQKTKNRPYYIDNYLSLEKNIIRKNKINKIFSLKSNLILYIC